MTDHTVHPFDAAAGTDAWDALVDRSVNGTFLHTQRYLSYHGDRFTDVSVEVVDAGGRLVGVLPAAVDPDDEHRVISHPGITYGGVVHDGTLRGHAMIGVLRDAAQLWYASGFRSLRYKPVPHIYHRAPGGDDEYALFRLGASLGRVDLSATIDLDAATAPNRNRRRNLTKAAESGITVVSDPDAFARFWPILASNLETRFAVRPVHSLDEIEELARRFPTNISCTIALQDDAVVAGVVHYRTPRVLHPQYSASSDTGRTVGALDLLFQSAIADARTNGARYYDFGISTVDQGQVLNDSLYAFKLSFGAGGVPFLHFDLDLDSARLDDPR